MNNWTFECITDWETIWSDHFTGKWLAWLEKSRSSHVFFHPALVKAWVETYIPLRDISPLFFIAKKAHTTVFLPLVLWKKNWKNAYIHEVVPVGYSDFDYHDPLIVGAEEGFAQNRFWASWLTALERLDVNYDSVNITGIRSGTAACGQNWHEEDLCPYCDISGFLAPEDFLPSLKARLRGDLGRQIRRLTEQGDLTYHVYAPNDVNGGLTVLPDFLTLHAERWPHAYKASSLHENILRRGLEEGIVHFSELRLDEKPMSWHFGFIYRERFYYYLPAIDPHFSKLSPGKVHLLKCVEDAIHLKLSVFDHLRGEESYKSGWTNQVEKLNTFTVKKHTTVSTIKSFLVERVKPLITRRHP